MSWLTLPAALLVLGGALPGTVADGSRIHPGTATLQHVQDPVRPPTPYAASVLDTDPEARILAVSILFPAGSSRDPVGREGTAALLASVLRLQARGALGRHQAALETELSENDLLVTLLTPYDAWREAIITLEMLLYEAPLSQTAFAGARSEILEVLAFESGAPVRAFELERARLLLGPDAWGARPILGSPDALASITLADLETFRATHLRTEGATLAAHGPVEAAELASLLSSDIEELSERSRAGRRSEAPPGSGEQLPPAPLLLHLGPHVETEIPPPGARPAAWEEGKRILVDRELTSSWISAAFPFPRETPDLLLQFLAHLVREELTPVPPERGLFHADASTMEIEGAPVLVLTASIDPQITLAWEERLVGVMGRMAVEPPDGAFFGLAKRRFRTQALLELALPEARVEWMARRRAAGLPHSPDLVGEIWGLNRSAVMRTAELAGPAHVIVYGPRAMMGP